MSNLRPGLLPAAAPVHRCSALWLKQPQLFALCPSSLLSITILEVRSHTRPPCSPDVSLACGPSGHLLCTSVSFLVAPLCLLFTLGTYFSSWVLTSDSFSHFLDSRGEYEQTVCKHRLVDFAESLPAIYLLASILASSLSPSSRLLLVHVKDMLS